ncbi:MAG: sensor histidine kinase [Acidobacteriia bacterium]|nr:sensor histidine kinase [Terriglobia bacterium]
MREALKQAVLLFLILLISVFHFATPTEYIYLHEIYQRFYYIPIILAAFWYGPLWGFLASALTSVLYGIHIHRDWIYLPTYSFNQYAEIFLYNVIGLLIGFLSLRERRHREKLEKTSGELSQAYERLRSAFEQLKQSDRLAALGQLSAGIAHEIRNPLGSIKGSIEILETEIAPDNPKHEFVRIIKEETARLNSIVAEFLRFARPPKPAVELASLNELISSTLNLLQKEAEHSRVEIRKCLDPLLPEVNVDRDQIRQVLLNVVLNGIQAMPQGGVLEVSSARADGKVVVEVADNGPGLEEEDLERVFDPFFTTKPQGTGLGLSISYQLLQRHGGRINAERNAGRGMTFRIELPIAPLSAK